jgi:hypothetical protein
MPQPSSSKPPPGFTRDITAIWANKRGLDAPHWPAPRPLLKPDLSNADFPAGAWAWEGDVLIARGLPAWQGGKANLWTKENYGNFVLSFDFRPTEGANGGILIRVGDIADWLQTSMEIQLLQGSPENPKQSTGALYDCLAPKRSVTVEPNHWYNMVIMAQGSRLAMFFDTELINDVKLDDWKEPRKNPDGSPNKFKQALKDRARTGRLGLQYHGKRIDYRNLLVEELPD